jgi:HD-GYP domain-containing protein (c-di-GMP phosphodiesterase class II)
MADGIDRAQQQLAQDIADATSGEDKQLSLKVRELGEQLARLLSGLLRMARMHALTNAAFDAPVSQFRGILRELWEMLGTVNLVCVEDQVYVNDVRIRFEMSAEHVESLADDLARHGVGGISFNQVLEEADVRKLVELFHELPPEDAPPRPSLQKKLADAGMVSMELHGLFRFKVQDEVARSLDRDYALLYTMAVAVVGEAFTNISADRLPNPIPVRRMINELIDAAKLCSTADLATDHDRTFTPLARHTMMVVDLSLLLGRAAGLADEVLADLGIAAAFHDVGAAMTDGGYPVPYERHATAGLRALMRQRGFHQAKTRRLLAVAEHHNPFESDRGRPSLFARIIHIVDDYDLMTRNRPNEGPVMAPTDALARMIKVSGTVYDPVLLQVFVNQMGMFPPGSLLALASGRTVVSVSGARWPETFAKPLCHVLRREDGTPARKGTYVDLAEEDRIFKLLRPRPERATGIDNPKTATTWMPDR